MDFKAFSNPYFYWTLRFSVIYWSMKNSLYDENSMFNMNYLLQTVHEVRLWRPDMINDSHCSTVEVLGIREEKWDKLLKHTCSVMYQLYLLCLEARSGITMNGTKSWLANDQIFFWWYFSWILVVLNLSLKTNWNQMFWRCCLTIYYSTRESQRSIQ